LKYFLLKYNNITPQTKPDQTRPDQTKPDQTKPDQTKPDKMFCKVCKDAGKSESVYVSHNVRGNRGNTTCPTLLSYNCKYCKEKGHTIKYCPVLQAKTKQTQEKSQEQMFQQRARELCSSPPPSSSSSPFAPSCPSKGKVVVVPTPVSKKPNYFGRLMVEEENDDDDASAKPAEKTYPKLKQNYRDIAAKRIEASKREWEETKEVDLKVFQENLEKNFPSLITTTPSKTDDYSPAPSSSAVWKKTLDAASTTTTRTREASPPPPSPPQNKPDAVMEEEEESDEEEEPAQAPPPFNPYSIAFQSWADEPAE
jgi:hypothetical protein